MPEPAVMSEMDESLRQQGCVIFAKDKQGVSAFYQQTLGLLVAESAASHDRLYGAGYEVIVHAIPRKVAASIEVSDPPEPRDWAAVKPTFVVPDLKAVALAARRTGGHLKSIDEAWHFRGFMVVDGWDPEGNLVQFKQPG